MKKTLLLAGIALMASIAACNKAEMPQTNPEGIKINISVAEPDLGTRAAKTGWASGDRINLFFDKWNDGATVDSYRTDPDMILIYDGSKWFIQSQSDAFSPKESGSFSAIYEGSNNLAAYPLIEYFSKAVWYHPLKTQNQFVEWKDVYHSSQYLYSANVAYTFDGTTVSAAIVDWNSNLCKIKVLVKTTDQAVLSNWENTVLQFKTGDAYASTFGAIVANIDYGYFFAKGSANYVGMSGAVPESEGLAFYYEKADATADQTITFTLIDAGNGAKREYSVTGKTLDSDAYKFKTIAIDYSKFTPVSAE
ncbi:MAG: hypothetical protein ACI4TJ_08045 [Candidatus Cryptobacteroides sp.]